MRRHVHEVGVPGRALNQLHSLQFHVVGSPLHPEPPRPARPVNEPAELQVLFAQHEAVRTNDRVLHVQAVLVAAIVARPDLRGRARDQRPAAQVARLEVPVGHRHGALRGKNVVGHPRRAESHLVAASRVDREAHVEVLHRTAGAQVLHQRVERHLFPVKGRGRAPPDVAHRKVGPCQRLFARIIGFAALRDRVGRVALDPDEIAVPQRDHRFRALARRETADRGHALVHAVQQPADLAPAQRVSALVEDHRLVTPAEPVVRVVADVFYYVVGYTHPKTIRVGVVDFTIAIFGYCVPRISDDLHGEVGRNLNPLCRHENASRPRHRLRNKGFGDSGAVDFE